MFTTLLLKVIPLYVAIGLGAVAGRWLAINRENLAKLLFYIIVPVVIFYSVAHLRITLALLTVPLLVFVFCSTLSLGFFAVARRIWPDSTANIVGFSAGTGNTGYFGIPIFLALYGEGDLGIYLMCTLGTILYENSLGFFITAKSHHTARESAMKVLRLPTLYAFVLGVLFSVMGWQIPPVFNDLAGHLRGCYAVLGLMMVGMGLASLRDLKWDATFLALVGAAKFLVWPGAMVALVTLDRRVLHLYDERVHHALLLMSLVPLAVNAVVFATLLNAQPEKASLAVLLSTLLALGYVPWMIHILLM